MCTKTTLLSRSTFEQLIKIHCIDVNKHHQAGFDILLPQRERLLYDRKS